MSPETPPPDDADAADAANADEATADDTLSDGEDLDWIQQYVDYRTVRFAKRK